MANLLKKTAWKLIEAGDRRDPAINLAIEEYAVRHLDPAYSYFFIYINAPAVVVGRHQNVLREVNLRRCWDEAIPILRRLSGGGTVAHDRGNLNFTFITVHTSTTFNRYRQFLQPIVDVLTALGAPVRIDERNDLRLEGKKISGNAQFTSRGRLLSHGTLLFDADLNRIKRLVHPDERRSIRDKAPPSVRSAMINVRPYLKRDISLDGLRRRIIEAVLGQSVERYEFNAEDWAAIEKLAEQKYRRFAWNIAQSPPCTVKVTAPDDRAFSFSYALIEGRFKNFSPSDARLRFWTQWLENRPLAQETFREMERRIEALPDDSLRKMSERVYKILI